MDTFWATFVENFATFYSNIWSHWCPSRLHGREVRCHSHYLSQSHTHLPSFPLSFSHTFSVLRKIFSTAARRSFLVSHVFDVSTFVQKPVSSFWQKCNFLWKSNFGRFASNKLWAAAVVVVPVVVVVVVDVNVLIAWSNRLRLCTQGGGGGSEQTSFCLISSDRSCLHWIRPIREPLKDKRLTQELLSLKN